MEEEPPSSKLDRMNRMVWLVAGVVTAILVVVIMIIIVIRGTGY